MNDLAATLLTWLVDYSYPIVGLTVLVAAIGVPLPSTVVILAAGAMASDGDPSPYGLVAVIVVAAVLGDVLSFTLARVGGGAALGRWGPRVGLTAERIALMERRFERWGGLLVVATRCLLTGLALPTNLIAGAGGYPATAFLGYALLGESIWAGSLTGLGWWYGANWVALLDYLNDAFTVLTALAVTGVLGFILVRLLRTPRV